MLTPAPEALLRFAAYAGTHALPLFFALLAARPSLGNGVYESDRRLLEAEVVHMARHEFARTVDDVLSRRTRLILTDARNGVDHAAGVARVLGDELGWDAARRETEVAAYAANVARMQAWRQPRAEA